MGALVSMQAAVLAPERVRRLVAIDTAGPMDLLAMPSVAAGALRLLPVVYPSPGAYFAGIQAMGIVEPWEDLWKRAFAYELKGFLGLVRPRTSFRAVAEDFFYNLVHTGTSLWPRLRLPTILVRATRRLPPFGLVVGAKVRDAFLRSAPSAELAEVDANHYEIMAHPGALRAIDEFLARPTVALPDSSGRPQTADERRAVSA
jgi:pimeloyl-ACP methyl ester carboxylesterase